MLQKIHMFRVQKPGLPFVCIIHMCPSYLSFYYSIPRHYLFSLRFLSCLCLLKFYCWFLSIFLTYYFITRFNIVSAHLVFDFSPVCFIYLKYRLWWFRVNFFLSTPLSHITFNLSRTQRLMSIFIYLMHRLWWFYACFSPSTSLSHIILNPSYVQLLIRLCFIYFTRRLCCSMAQFFCLRPYDFSIRFYSLERHITYI